MDVVTTYTNALLFNEDLMAIDYPRTTLLVNEERTILHNATPCESATYRKPLPYAVIDGVPTGLDFGSDSCVPGPGSRGLHLVGDVAPQGRNVLELRLDYYDAVPERYGGAPKGTYSVDIYFTWVTACPTAKPPPSPPPPPPPNPPPVLEPADLDAGCTVTVAGKTAMWTSNICLERKHIKVYTTGGIVRQLGAASDLTQEQENVLAVGFDMVYRTTNIGKVRAAPAWADTVQVDGELVRHVPAVRYNGDATSRMKAELAIGQQRTTQVSFGCSILRSQSIRGNCTYDTLEGVRMRYDQLSVWEHVINVTLDANRMVSESDEDNSFLIN